MARVQGYEALKAKVLKKRQQHLQALTSGVTKAGLFLQRESQKIVPVDYGVLKASAYTRVEGAGTVDVAVFVGYTDPKAIYVHENLEAAHGDVFNAKYAKELAAFVARRRKGLLRGNAGSQSPFRHKRGPNQQAKFLERPFRQKRREMLDIIKGEF